MEKMTTNINDINISPPPQLIEWQLMAF